jgi:hypothetical protein
MSANPKPSLSRRDWLRLTSAGAIGVSVSGWLGALAAQAADHPQRSRACILLWMSGGPSQFETFDPKPGHKNGGPTQAIASKVPGMELADNLPKLAQWTDHMAIIRSMTSKEGDHGRAAQFLRTGYLPQGGIHFPVVGSLLAKELGDARADIPSYVSISPYRQINPLAYSSGFLGPQFAPLLVGDSAVNGNGKEYDQLKVEDITLPQGISHEVAGQRLDMLRALNDRFASSHVGTAAMTHQMAYERAVRLMGSSASKAFQLDQESAEVRDAYGRTRFGQGCLLARRLVEHGVPFVEVVHGGDGGLGWDTHTDNFTTMKKLTADLDQGWSALLGDLKDRGLLDSTLVVWMGEFGRTPTINDNNGRDHFPQAFSTVLSGGGIVGGQTVGKTSPGGEEVTDRPTTVPDFLATVCQAVGIDPTKQNPSNVGRPIRVVDSAAKPIAEILG